MIKKCSWMGVLLALGACGGGGGGAGTPLPPPPAETRVALSADNQEQATRVALGVLNFSLDAADLGGGDTVTQLGVADGRRRALGLGVQPLKSSRLETPCPRGGWLVLVLDDLNNNEDLDVGDSLTTEMLDCGTEEGISRGKIVATVREASMTPLNTHLKMQVELQGLSTTLANGDQFGGSGSVTTTVDRSQDTATVLLESARLEQTGRRANVPYTHTVTGLRVQATSALRTTPVRRTLTATAQVTSTAFGGLSLSVDTDPNFVFLGDDAFPSSGQLLLRGASNSQLRVVALSKQQARLDVDANGDGVFERSTVYDWPALQP